MEWGFEGVFLLPLNKSGDNPFNKFDCPNTESRTKKKLNLPLFPSMTDDEASYVSESLIKLTTEIIT